ncbi:MAG: response regulator [Anaerolineaceae bacterium]|nr:response regulator [Anaerolineaceae bacterium]MCB9098138.1 response regulator [Anaerolineales bacterium]
MAAANNYQNEPQSLQFDRELIILQSASAAIMSSLDLEHVLSAVIGEMINLLGAEACTIFDWKPADNQLYELAAYRPLDWGDGPNAPAASFKLTDFPVTRRVMIDKLATQLTLSDGPRLAQTHAGRHNIRTLLILPMIFQERVIGLVDVMDRRRERVFSPKEVAMARLLANHAAIALENARLHAETERHTHQLALMHQLDRAITVSLRISDVYYAFASHVARMFSYDHMSITLLEKDHFRVSYAANTDATMNPLPVGTRLPYQASAAGWVVGHRQPLMRHNVAADSHFVEDEQLVRDQIKAHLIIPMRTQGKIIGTWNIGSRQIGAYSPDDLAMAQSVADQLAVAIANAQSYEQSQQEIAERKRVEAALEEERAMLAQRVAEQTADLRAANIELARIARLKDEFLANVSHELRTPLTAILGLCEMLNINIYGPLNDKQSQAVRYIEDSGRHLLALINDILDLAKVEADELELELRPVNIEAVCQASLALVKQMAHKKQLKVSLLLDSAIPVIQADERRLKQILVNLLSNAVKFTPVGGAVGLEVTRDVERDRVIFAVWDTGIGIAEAHRTQLFQPFVQLDNTLARQHTGTGLGLSLVYRLTKLHGGDVRLESKVGQGSRFMVSLPQIKENSGPDTSQSTSTAVDPKGTPAAETRDESSPGPLLLLAEDDKRIAELLLEFLTQQGYRVTVAFNGREALTKARLEPPALILMDVHMPELDGLTAIRQIRADSELAHIPVIALTARAMASDREQCLAAGANDYLSKPVSLAVLNTRLKLQLTAAQKVSDE